MQIPATLRAQQLIGDLMSTGRYKSPSDLVETALTSLAGQESFDLIRAELEQASARLTTSEFDALEEEAVEQLAKSLAEMELGR